MHEASRSWHRISVLLLQCAAPPLASFLSPKCVMAAKIDDAPIARREKPLLQVKPERYSITLHCFCDLTLGLQLLLHDQQLLTALDNLLHELRFSDAENNGVGYL